MASKDHDIESQTGELVVDTGDEELRVGLLDLPALFIGIRLAPVALHDHVVLDNGFCQGILSHEGFLSWVRSSPDIQASKLSSIAWIRSNRNILHHQFIIVTVEYQSTLYDVKIERAGLMAGPGDVAKQTITIQPSVPLHGSLEGNDLILALVGKENSLISPEAKQHRKVYPFQRNFVTFDDERWRGAPATLGQLARYSKIVVTSAPDYHLRSTNCYFYARMMMHIIVDRHLTFEYAVSPGLTRFYLNSGLESGERPLSGPEGLCEGNPQRAPKVGPPILFPMPFPRGERPLYIPPSPSPSPEPIVVPPPVGVVMPDLDEDEFLVGPPPPAIEQPPFVRGDSGPFVISRSRSPSPRRRARRRRSPDSVSPVSVRRSRHGTTPVVVDGAPPRRGSEPIIVRTRSPSPSSDLRRRRSSNSIRTVSRSPSPRYRHVRSRRPYYPRSISPYSIDSPALSPASRSALMSVLERHEEQEGTLLATYIESVTLFVASSVAMLVPLGMLIALILLLAAFGRPNTAVPLAFALAPTLIIILIALRIVMAVVRSHTKSIRRNLVGLRSDIFAEIEFDRELKLPPSVPRAFQHRSTLRKKEALVDFLDVFCKALKSGAPPEVERLFAEDGWLRVLTNQERVLPSIAKSDIPAYLQDDSLVLSDLKVTSDINIIELRVSGRKPDLQAFFCCSNSDVPGLGVAWLTPDTYGVYKANIVSLVLQPPVGRLEIQRSETNSKPVGVVVVGAGMSGVFTAVQLKKLGIDVIILEKSSRPGNSWRTRYHAPEIRFPRTALGDESFSPPADWPEFISPVEMANWIEGYAVIMGLDIWTNAIINPGNVSYEDAAGIWELSITHDGRQQTLRCYHIILATGAAGGEPRQMAVPGQDTFDGTVMHASEYRSEAKWDGKPAIVVGCGNSGHDIAASLNKLGASVTLVQRSPTRVISRNASLAGSLYNQPIYSLCRLLVSYPPDILCQAKNELPESLQKVDQLMFDGLRAVGFKVDVAPFSPYRLQSHIHIDIGCSDLLASGEIQLLTSCEPERFEGRSLVFTNGTSLEADLIVLATGYETMDETCRHIFGSEVADRVGPAWSPDGTPVGVCARTGHPRFWYSGGNVLLARAYAVRLSQLIASSLSSSHPEEYKRSANALPNIVHDGIVPPWAVPSTPPSRTSSTVSSAYPRRVRRIRIPPTRQYTSSPPVVLGPPYPAPIPWPGVAPPRPVVPLPFAPPAAVSPAVVMVQPPVLSASPRIPEPMPSIIRAVGHLTEPYVISEESVPTETSPAVQLPPVPHIVVPQHPAQAVPPGPVSMVPIAVRESEYFTPTESSDSSHPTQ